MISFDIADETGYITDPDDTDLVKVHVGGFLMGFVRLNTRFTGFYVEKTIKPVREIIPDLGAFPVSLAGRVGGRA